MKNKRWIAAISALIAFIIITYFVSTGKQLAFDTVIRECFYSLRSQYLNSLIIALTYLGNTKTIIVICLVLLILPRTRMHYGIPVSAAAITASSFNYFLKHIFNRPRPDIGYHIIEQGGWSFPSGHSITSLVVFGLLIWLIHHANTGASVPIDKRRCKQNNVLTVLLLIPCFGIGLSRIYVGVHYPTDVLGGWMLGIIVIILTITIIEALEQRNKKQL